MIKEVTRNVVGKVGNLSKKSIAESAIGAGVGIVTLCAGYLVCSMISDSRKEKKEKDLEKIQEMAAREDDICRLENLVYNQNSTVNDLIGIIKGMAKDVDYLMSMHSFGKDCDDDSGSILINMALKEANKHNSVEDDEDEDYDDDFNDDDYEDEDYSEEEDDV